MTDFNFTHFKEFFEYNFNKHSRNQSGVKILTLQDLAYKLGYKSPSLLSMIASGKRLPSNQMLEDLLDEWKIDSEKREIVRLKLEIEKRIAKNRPATNAINRLALKDKKYKYHTIEIEAFNSIKDWHNLVLKHLIGTPLFKEDPTYLSLLLKKKITPAQVKKSIETLLNSGMIFRNQETGELYLDEAKAAETTHDIPSEAIREHHKGMIQRALETIDEESIEKRHINSLTLQFDHQKSAEAKEFILNFVKQFNEKFHAEQSSDVRQLNVQFYQHTNTTEMTNNKSELIQ